jgi:enoyl-CoA hydratase/carnithine racemase
LKAEPVLRVLVVTGSGGKTFCAGAALDELSSGGIGDDAFQGMTSALAELPMPTVCAVNGNVFGGGAELALSCDFRIGMHGTRMRVPAASIGLCYPLPGIRQFVTRLGVHNTKRILVASEEFSAGELLNIGFYDKLASPENFDSVVDEYAGHIAGLAPLAVRAMKKLLQQAVPVEIDAVLASQLSQQCLNSEDLQEGFAAKREKRSPVFRGA